MLGKYSTPSHIERVLKSWILHGYSSVTGLMFNMCEAGGGLYPQH